MHTPSGCPRTLRRLAGAALLAVALPTTPTWAATWAFASDAPLLLGGALSGQFSGSDLNSDAQLDAGELSAFSVSYAGAPPATTSFSINKPVLDGGDRFSFDLATGTLSFSVLSAAGLGVSGGSFEFTTVVGADFIDAGGQLNVSAVPEPAPAALLLGGLAAMAMQLRRRRHR